MKRKDRIPEFNTIGETVEWLEKLWKGILERGKRKARRKNGRKGRGGRRRKR